MDQLANPINNWPMVTLPSNTEVNPKRGNDEHCKAITLWSGKELIIEKSNSSVKHVLVEEQEVLIHEEKRERKQVEFRSSWSLQCSTIIPSVLLEVET